MTHTNYQLEIFLVTTPGLEAVAAKEAKSHEFTVIETSAGGVTITGNWVDCWRANYVLRCPSKILVRIASFRVMHLAQLDKRTKKIDWSELLYEGAAVKVETSCKKSKIYHSKAASQRIEQTLKDSVKAKITDDASIVIKARIINDLCTISIDTSGENLHKRGFKQAVNKAPMRENIAASLLFASGYDGTAPVIDPMCGSGSFLLEAAAIARDIPAGKSRNFAFQDLKTFDPKRWRKAKVAMKSTPKDNKFFGYDRDAGAVKITQANIDAAGLTDFISVKQQTISDLVQDTSNECDTQCGLIIANPPYGKRIGDVKKLMPLYQTFGNQVKKHYPGWRIAIATNNKQLAYATGLEFEKAPLNFDHGGTRVSLYQCIIPPK